MLKHDEASDLSGLEPSVCPSVHESRPVCDSSPQEAAARVSERASERCLVSRRAAVRLPVTWASAPSPRVCGAVGLSESALECVWAPPSPLPGVSGFEGREQEGRRQPGERGGAGAETVGGRGRRAARRGVCGGPEAAVTAGSACAGERWPPPAPGGAARPGLAWPPQTSPVLAVMRPSRYPPHTPSLASPLLFLLLSLLGGGAGAEGREDPQLLVKVRGGQLRGIRLKAPGGPVSAFLGIPFAEPPVGSRRFMPPEPKRPWSEVLDATAFQNVCYQYVDTLYPGFEGIEMWNPNRAMSEDCLYLNVWAPYPRPTSPTPVLIWIYGGGFYSGATSLDVYDGRFLAQVEGTVLVSMNYRVGTFGFLALPGSREAPGNVGLLDQRLALQWVQENIAAFGGNPMSVTLFGESAGAASVGMHILSLPSRSLFHRAVLQSGTPNGPWATVGAGEARRRATLLAHLVGCPPGGAGVNDTELIACLRTRPAQDLVDHEWHVLPQESVFRFPFVPVVDGDFLSDTPEALISAGDFQDLQVLVGVVKDEGSYFLVYGVPGFSKDNESLINRAQFLAGVRIGVPQASDLAAEAVVLHYTDWLHPEDPVHLRDAVSAVVGDHNVVCPVAQLAGRLAAQGARVYAYVFEHRASTMTWPLWMGVPHGYEIEFIFGLPLDPSLNYTMEERIFAQRLMKYWTNFARTGDPNDPRDSKSPQWPPYTTGAQQYVSLNLKPLEVRRGLRAQTCAFWNRFLPKLLSATDTLDEAERQWKAEFHRWSSYMVHWKNQFDHYSKQERCSDL
ncbi:acetylcholinesterase isoform X2 [Peromyscus californicus insignis]|uniref:acetylcholinesterase isoform X2 n=1 Tax=Peromyscus californicus insignis TaxID=564181 RepID=UPI0022A6619F|nr:acetylcholinesterase isoform X2 [Peromyscus californicus insignis]